ncbi:Mtm1p [Lachancea thermotolerans CBS 6340]|uniref:KLTH0B08712p n=1 Tax=Lachancea thermotolerans (strain ATCC 56472 / CBS 6340 / NRRL Y-8284) TaxID=559295 RepID=C5DD67_LACTC|nr:KLTH0B08712p [Lachancea thermotolerans CBS 6340]CAR21728.1 KLTH0B08712p [Lachancea thermotolerans CBS 6340]
MSNEKKEGIGLKERLLSAVAGSLLTSLILTPMDVVRIRLQQQKMLPSCDCDANGKLSLKTTAPKGVFWQDACFADVHCQTSSVNYNSTWDAFTKIARIEGARSLWRGLSITLVMAVPANMVYFIGYESLRDNSFLQNKYSRLNPLLCGAIARVLAATTVAPLELFRTRLQSIPRSSPNSTAAMMVKDLIKESRYEISRVGYKALFRGLEITLWRDVPFSSIYWGCYEFYKSNISIKSERSIVNSSNTNWNHFVNSFVGGSFGGAVAAILTHPFDVGKTRMQISFLNNTPGKSPSKNMFKYLNQIRKSEGLGALYTGLVPRVIKIAPSCAIMISTYEVCKRLFST